MFGLDYTIPVLQFVKRNSGELEMYDSGKDLVYHAGAGDRKGYLEHQRLTNEGDACRIVAYPPDGLPSAPAEEWALMWFRGNVLTGDVRVSVLKAFAAGEEYELPAVARRIVLGGWSIAELLEEEIDESSAASHEEDLINYADNVCAQPAWADAIMDDVNAQITASITGWQKTAVIDPPALVGNIRIEEPGLYYIVDSDEIRVPCDMVVQISLGPGVTAVCHTCHNVNAENGARVFIFGPTSALLAEGSSAYIDGGRSVVTLGACDLMVLRDAGQVHCYGEKPAFLANTEIVL